MHPVPFVHLHNRSEYSLLRSTLRVRELVRLAAECTMPAVALTDRMNLHGLVQFYDACYRSGIRPIVGAELALEPIASVSVDPLRPALFDAVVIAEDNIGYQRLCELLTRAHLDSPGPTPSVRTAWLEELGGHWIVLSGGRDSEVFQLLRAGDDKRARQVAEQLVHLAGPGRFYIELQWHLQQDERTVLPKLIELARQLNIPAVATNQCACATRDEAPALDLLRRIESGEPAAPSSDAAAAFDHLHFRTCDEMASIFRNAPEAVSNTMVIANRCAVELNLGTAFLMPHVEPPDGMTPRAQLERECNAGLERRFPDWRDESAATPHHLSKKKRHDIQKRLEFEIDTIATMGFISYFLVVSDFVAYARRQGIPVGPGRGSAAGSLVSFLLGITDIDPLDYGLLFERFLNPSRKKMPDIDMDFCERRRGEVIQYVRQKYGEDKVAQIATFSTLRARAAVRDTCRACAVPDIVADKLCALLAEFQRSHEHGRSGIIPLALEHHEALRELYHHDATAKRVLDLAARIEDLPRNLSTHAAGVVISPVPLRTILPLTRGADGEVMTQFDMHAVDRVGLLKMDFLGLTTLTIVSDTLDVIRQTTGSAPDLQSIPLDDEPTYALLRQGTLLGIFQLETSGGMRRLVQDMRMSDFNDLIAVLALYRPGAMHASASYVARKLGREPVSYPHPKLEPILKDTFGIFLYQEQVMQCLHALAGYTLAEADIFRQIMSKKLTDQIGKEHGKFVKRAVEKEIDHDLAERLFEDIAKFANYGFNKSHATAYAFVAYWTAYLKANHTAAFFASMLNSKADTPEKLLECHQDCRTQGIALRVPDGNASATAFTVERDEATNAWAIRFGLEAIRNVGPAAAEEIVRERVANGPFNSIDNLCRRVNHRLINRKALDSLVKAGACDSFGMPRQRMCLIVDDATATWERSGESALQRSFFDAMEDTGPAPASPRAQLDSITEWDSPTRLSFEKEALGLYLTGHPLDHYAAVWRALVTADARNTGYQHDSDDDTRMLGPIADQHATVMGGLVLGTQWRMSKKGRSYGVVTFEDFFGTFEVLLWSEQVDHYRAKIAQGQIWFMQGAMKLSFGRTSPAANLLAPAEHAIREWPRIIKITLHQKRLPQNLLAKLATTLKAHPGTVPVEIIISSQSLDKPIGITTGTLAVQPSEQLFEELEQVAGKGTVTTGI